MSTDDTEKRDTRSEGAALCAQLETLEMAFMAKFLDTILSRFQATSAILQQSNIAIVTAVRALESLHDFVAAQRDIFDSFERAALSLPGVGQTYRHDSHRRKRHKIVFADKSGKQDIELDGRCRFEVETFNVAIDMLTQSL